VIYKRLNDFGIKLENPWTEIRRMGAQSARKEREKLKKKYSTKKLFEMALSYTLGNKLYEAREFFELTTEKDPNYFLAWVNMGIIYTYHNLLGKTEGRSTAWYKRHYDEGIECFKKALELRPYDITCLIGLGDAYRGKKEFAKSIECFREIIKRTPKNFEDLSGIGFTFLNANSIKYRLEEKAIDEFVPINKDYQLLRQSGSYLEKENKIKYDIALRSMSKVLKYQKMQELPNKYIISREIYSNKRESISKIIRTIEYEKEKAEWKETKEYRDLEDKKIIEFIKPYKEIAICTITEHFLSKGKYADPKKYYQTAKDTIKEKLNSLIEKKIIQGSIQSLPNKIGLYYINEEKIEEIKIKIVYQTLIEFSGKFPRIFLQEIVEKVNHKIEKQFNNSAKMSQLKVKEIVISLINKRLIFANYDDSSNGIEFLVMERKIDELFTKFDEWSEEDKKKV
jgi:tetratricopeptide (TPR) repeat protein